jgi:DNA-binding transcriptional MocR family regulator
MIDLAVDADERRIVQAAAKQSMRLCGASIYRSKPDAGPPALVLGYATLQVDGVDDAVRRLATMLREHAAVP